MPGQRPGAPAGITALEEAAVLDRLGNLLGRGVRAALSVGKAKDFLSGDWLGHPLHPMLTDIPIGVWTSSLLLDALGGPQSRQAVDRLIAIGIFSALPTAASGLADWSDTQVKGSRVGLVHAAANTGALALFSASLMARRDQRRAQGVLYSVAGAGALAVGGYLGGHLSYALGVGVDQTAIESS
ncbi:MAG: DUF2231 domain-containing protein [Solirubrobacteraceae bacterium]